MKTEMTIARKLTLDEIKELPKATVLWIEFVDETDEGIIWHSVDPVLVCAPGPGGALIGGNKDSFIDLNIDDDLLKNGRVFWDREPNREQLTGINQDEYDTLTGEGKIIYPALARAITGQGMTFDRFCDSTGLNYGKFWKALTGQREFVCSEIVAIRTALDLSDNEVNEIFFLESMAQI